MAGRSAQTVREAFDYLAIAEREAQDVIAGLARMQAHAGLALTVGDALDALQLADTIVARAMGLVGACAARMDTLDTCANEPDESNHRVVGSSR